MKRILSLVSIVFITLLFSASAHAHFLGGWWGHGGSEVDYACKPHHHGRFLHRCSDEPHNRMDVSHSHNGLPPYYARNTDFYLGVKGGMLSFPDSALDEDGMTSSIVAGYGTHALSVEAEISRARIRIFDDFSFSPSEIGSGRYDTLALFGVYRTSANVYGKMKVGYRKYWIATDSNKIIDGGFTAGFGVGKNLGRFVLEGEYTMIESSMQFLSVGLNYKF